MVFCIDWRHSTRLEEDLARENEVNCQENICKEGKYTAERKFPNELFAQLTVPVAVEAAAAAAIDSESDASGDVIHGIPSGGLEEQALGVPHCECYRK